MSPLYLALLSALDIVLYTIRSYTSKLFADAYDGPEELATPSFSVIIGFCGYLLTVIFFGGLRASLSLNTLLCGVTAGAVLALYNLGCIRAATTGPYSVQSVIGMFGCVLLPLLFEHFVWGVNFSMLQYAGFACVLVSFVLLNCKKSEGVPVQKGYYGWVALLFFSNGVYSILMAAQHRWSGGQERSEMVASVFLSLAMVSLMELLVKHRGQVKSAFHLSRKGWTCALLSSVSLTIAMNLLVLLLAHVSASVLYPIQNSAILVLLVLLSAVHLKEKLNPYMIAGILLALVGIGGLSG